MNQGEVLLRGLAERDADVVVSRRLEANAANRHRIIDVGFYPLDAVLSGTASYAAGTEAGLGVSKLYLGALDWGSALVGHRAAYRSGRHALG